MDSTNKLQSEEDLNSDRKYQTSSNNMSNTYQNIVNHNSNNKFNSMTVYKQSDIPKINMKNIRKIGKSNPMKTRMPKKNMKSQTSFVEKLPQPNRAYKTSPYTFKYFCNMANKKKSLYNSSLGINSIKENHDMESNFVNLSKNANMYTSNAEYIQNKKMLLFDKTNYDDSKYKPDRANIFDMTNIPIRPNKNSTLYKTTMFRGGKLYFEKKLDNVNKAKLRKKVKDKFYENMPIDNMIKFIAQNKENLFPKISKKSSIISDDSQENISKNDSQYNSLYKKLMSKRDEIFDNLLNNNINKNNKIIIRHNPHQRNISNLNANNSSTLNPQNNSIDTNTNFFNNSSFNKINNSSNKFNNSSKNISNFSTTTNLLSKKNNDGIPILFPMVCSTFAKCNSMSQSSRYNNIMENFIKVKTFIENDKLMGKENEFDYIREFLMNKKIDKKHMSIENLRNFSNFLKNEEIPIDLNKSLKENILIGLYYDGKKSKFNSLITNNKDDYSPKRSHKYYRNKILLNNRINYKLNKKENNFKSLILDLPRQSKLHENDEDKNDYKLKDELQQEINIIENEIQDKQNIIKQVEKKLHLTPLYYNYYNNLKISKLNNEKKGAKSIELRLASRQEANKSNISSNISKKESNEKKLITNGNIYDSNERLYYSWYRDKKKGDINNFRNKIKLTEFIMYNKTKEKIINEKFGLK